MPSTPENRVGQSEATEQQAVPVYLTPDEICSLLAQYKDRHLSAADAKLAEAYKAAIGKEI